MINAQAYPNKPTICVTGYTPSGPLRLMGQLMETTPPRLDVPGVRIVSATGNISMFEPNPEWLQHHQATPDGDLWRIVKQGLLGAETVYNVPAVWGLTVHLC